MSYNCLNCRGDGYIEVHSPEGDYIKSCSECGGTGKRQITIQLHKYDMLKAELARYKQENEQLKADCDRFKERLQISPYGDDKIDELDEALENYKFQYEQLKLENEQLRAQMARMREALIIANNYMPDVGHFCTCGQCKKCGANINYASYGYCLKCARVIIDEALSDTPADYHNPADVEALRKAREALKQGINQLEKYINRFEQTPEEDACIEMHEAVVEIDKALEIE